MAEIPVKPQGEGAAKSKTWVWWIVAAIVVILLFFLFSGRSSANGITGSSVANHNASITTVAAFGLPIIPLKQAA